MSKMSFRFVLAALGISFAGLGASSLTPAQAANEPNGAQNPSVNSSAQQTFETRLSNGMHVVVREDHRAPTAVQMVWYRVGSIDEHDGVTGVAHVTEHMMFKGTPKVGPGEFNRRVAAVGGRDNAFTSTDFTA